MPAAPAIRKQAQEALAKQFDFEAERLKHVVNIDGLSPAERSTIHGERLAYGAAARLCRGEQIIDQAARERREVELARQQERQRIREALEEEVRQRATGDWGEYEQGFLAGLRFLDSLEDDDA